MLWWHARQEGIDDARREGIFDEPLSRVRRQIAVGDGVPPPTEGPPSISNPDRRTPRANQVGTTVLHLVLAAPQREGLRDGRVHASPYREERLGDCAPDRIGTPCRGRMGGL